MKQNLNEKIHVYLEKYKYRKLAFNKSVIKETGLILDKVAFKCKMKTFHCILYAASMIEASILTDLSYGDFELIEKNNKKVTLKISLFSKLERKEISFFVECRMIGSSIYKGKNKNLYLISLEYLKDCPRDLVYSLGRYIEKETNLEKRIYQRFPVDHQYEQGKSIQPSSSYLFMSGTSRKCILSEISIFSAKIIIFGKAEEYIDKKAILIIKTLGMSELGELIGIIKRCEDIDPEKGLMSLIMIFDQDSVPPNYKMWVGEYIEYIARKYKK